MQAAKIPRDQRYLLLAGAQHVTPWLVWRTLHLKRWCGQRPDVLASDGSLTCGFCGHVSFFRWRIRLHRHPGDEPVPEDLQAALRGEAPVPDWFRNGQLPPS